MTRRSSTAPNLGRKKLSGPAALAVLGDGWTGMSRGSVPPNGMKDGPDIVLTHDAKASSMWDYITRSLAPTLTEADA